ncbi:MAG: MCP four helix bundle domain-containing protein [Proteobacteria bacterium]|nr:MCP four helix bundle domain-containing protein [Pseudomonadota bacterium]
MFNWIRDASVGLKLALAPAFAILCLVVVAATGLLANTRLGEALVELGQQRVPSIASVGELDRDLRTVHTQVTQSMAWEGAGYKAEKIAALDKQVLDRLVSLQKELQARRTRATDPELQRRAAELETEFGKYAKLVADALDVKTGMVSNAASYIQQMDESFVTMAATLDAMVVHERKLTDASVQASVALVSRNQWIISACLAVALVASLAITLLMSRTIVAPLVEAARVARSVASGNLTDRPKGTPSGDATGQVLGALGDVSQQLGQMIGNIRGAADQIETASREIATGNQDLSTRTEQTASSLQMTASTIEQLSAQMQHNNQTAARVNQIATEAATVAREGGSVVQGVVQTMGQINTQAQRIRDIIAVIDGIAFQTNILSLNAAVEAARAGEQGRGFAVVAQEVRALATRSSDAAKEIRTLIGASVEQASAGSERVNAAGQLMERIVGRIEEVAMMVSEITRANTEQAQGVAGVSQAVGEMDRSTQQNAALVEQAAAATESLRQQAQGLMHAIAVFRTA